MKRTTTGQNLLIFLLFRPVYLVSGATSRYPLFLLSSFFLTIQSLPLACGWRLDPTWPPWPCFPLLPFLPFLSLTLTWSRASSSIACGS